MSHLRSPPPPGSKFFLTIAITGVRLVGRNGQTSWKMAKKRGRKRERESERASKSGVHLTGGDETGERRISSRMLGKRKI